MFNVTILWHLDKVQVKLIRKTFVCFNTQESEEKKAQIHCQISIKFDGSIKFGVAG